MLAANSTMPQEVTASKTASRPNDSPSRPEVATHPLAESLWTPTDLANYLQVSVRFTQRLLSAGKLPAPIYVGRLPRWPASVIRSHFEGGAK